MKILLVRDDEINIDLNKSSGILNTICNTVNFESFHDIINIGSQLSYINIYEEIGTIKQITSSLDKDYTIYLTNRRYSDNFFFHSDENVMILSFFGWQYYTNLPLENGLFYFIATHLALQLDDSFRHPEITGCIYDFLENKTGVDTGMKIGYICGDCFTRIRNKVKKSKSLSNILADLIEISNLMSNTSKLGESVFNFDKDKELINLDWSTFEDEVAQVYRQLGAKVKQNVNFSGFQIDIYLEEETSSRQTIRTAVECKFSKAQVGNRTVNDFSRVTQTLKEAGIIDKGIIVSYSGFSQDASLVAKTTGVELLRFEDLKGSKSIIKLPPNQKVRNSIAVIEEKELQVNERKEKSPEIFVLMPFSPDLDDVYHLGIHEIAKNLKSSCERVDEIEFVGSVLDKIYNSIINSKIIICEVTTPNSNVYYELGYAHALNKPVILITKDISTTPFDLQGYNHIVYRNIVELREKLERRLKVLLD